MGFHLNKGLKVFAASAVTLNSVSSFNACCNPIEFESIRIDSIDCLGSDKFLEYKNKFFYGKFYELCVMNLGLTFYFHITNMDKTCKRADFIEFYENRTAEMMRTMGKFIPDGFYEIDHFNSYNYDASRDLEKSYRRGHIKKPDDLDSKLSNKDFYNICKKISDNVA